MSFRWAALALAAMLLSACGYKVGGKADLLPATIKTIAVPVFGNVTIRYKMSELLSADITREFLARTRYKVVAEPDRADAILYGSVVNFFQAPTIFDQRTGRAAGIQVSVFINLKLVDRATGKTLYQRDNMEIRQRYEISTDPSQFFEESGPAMARLSQDVARQVVSTVLEGF
jgi:hypothetical protein